MFEESKDPIISEVWNRKKIADDKYGDCFESVKKVYEGGHVRVDWGSALECSANIKYAKPDGTRLVLIDKDPGMINMIISLVYLVTQSCWTSKCIANVSSFSFQRQLEHLRLP